MALGLVLGASAACVTEIVRMAAGRNQHTVIPGRLYRSAQLTPEQLEEFVRRHGIRTVVNLRGRPFDEWYLEQMHATQALGISQEDITTSASRLPSPVELGRLIEVFDRAEHPLLIHCQQGADRTGLAAAVYQLLYTDATFEVACRQCSPRYGHFAVHSTAAIDDFFDRYAAWLRGRGESHSPAAFRVWATGVYCPGPHRGRLELLGPAGPLAADRPFVFTVRAYNTSPEPWHLKTGSAAGVYAEYVVMGPNSHVPFTGRAGLFDQVVPAGGYIDLDLPVPPVVAPGRYRLFVELRTRKFSFTQYGSEALIHDWDARDPAPPRGP